MADSIEDLLYDKYNKYNKYSEKKDYINEDMKSIDKNNGSNELSLSSISKDKKDKLNDLNDISLSSMTKDKKEKSINREESNDEIEYNSKDNENGSENSYISDKKGNLDKKEDNNSGTEDKFLESIIHESKDENTDEDKFINSLDNNNDYKEKKYLEKNKNKEFKFLNQNEFNNKEKNEEEILVYSNLNIKNTDDSYNENYKNIKKNKNNNFKKNNKDKNIANNKNIEEKTESTKINSKKSNPIYYNKKEYITMEMNSMKRMRNIKKIHLNSTSKASKTDNKKIKILKSNKLMPNAGRIKNDNKYVFKLIPKKPRLFITKTYNSTINYKKKPLLNVINDCYFCTKELQNLNIKNKKNKNINKEYNKYTYRDLEEINNAKFKKISNHKNKEKIKEPQMWTELDLDKNRYPSKIRIKINNPFYPLYQFNQNDKNKKISLNKIKKSLNKQIDNNIHIKRDSNSNQNIVKINSKKYLAPLKLKRRTKTNSTSSIYSIKSDSIWPGRDYNHFNNKEIVKAMGRRFGRYCDACQSIKNQQREYLNNKLNDVKSLEYKYRKNNYMNEDIRKKRAINNEEKNYYSYSRNKKIKKIKKEENVNNISNDSLSSKYANYINIEFPALSSYFH